VSIASNSPDAHLIRKLTPLSTLSSAHFEALCGEISIERQNPGYILFRRGDSVKDYVYLLEGNIRLQSDEFSIETVSAQEGPVRFPLAHHNPRKIDAVAMTPIRFFHVSIENINAPPEDYYKYEEQKNGYMVNESESESEPEASSGDWMSALLSSPVFQRLPPANLQKVLTTMETVEVKADTLIMKQGDAGDYYYFIRKGECAVTRKPATDAKEIKLAHLRRFETFGEDALISGKPREATVTAATDAILLRMNKDKFNTLIKEPIIHYMDISAAQQLLQQQSAILLDVREPDAYNALHIGSSQNMPFFSLRMQLKNLTRDKKIVLIDQNGKLSEAAAFLLIKAGYDAGVIKGGIDKLPPDMLIGSQATAPASATAVLPEDKSPDATTEAPAAADRSLAEKEPSLDSLIAENDALKASLEQLQQKYQALATDKLKLEKNFRLLMAQTEKLKEMLRKAQTGGAEP
jgi:CRP-like cAMP-binding protein